MPTLPDNNPPIQRIESSRLSYYRTNHEFLNYGEFTTIEDYEKYIFWAKERKISVLTLGSGSNILFCRKRVHSLILKNRLPKTIQALSTHSVEASSSVMIAEVLKWCESRDLDSFYYLASVPATVGGAVAMNAGRGRGHNLTILDYVESITVARDGLIRSIPRKEITVGYRSTPFTGLNTDLIVSVVFCFPADKRPSGSRKERVAWSKENQDHSAPNCGSVFKEWDRGVMTRLLGWRLFGAAYSKRTLNWILCTGTRSWPVVALIRLTQLLHRLKGKRALLEVIEVE